LSFSLRRRRRQNGGTRATARRDEANPRNSITFRKASTSEGRFCRENFTTKKKVRIRIQYRNRRRPWTFCCVLVGMTTYVRKEEKKK
jgi:hypothetical protein